MPMINVVAPMAHLEGKKMAICAGILAHLHQMEIFWGIENMLPKQVNLLFRHMEYIPIKLSIIEPVYVG